MVTSTSTAHAARLVDKQVLQCIVQCISDSDDRLCCLCDRVVNVRLSPCGHSTMCSECAGTAKRCPECRVSSSSGTLSDT